MVNGAVGLRSSKPFINQEAPWIRCCDVFALSKNDRSSKSDLLVVDYLKCFFSFSL